MLRPTQLTDRQRARIGSTWLHRAEEEEKASSRYATLARSLAAHQAPNDLIELCLRSAQDEARHARLCLELAQEFLGRPMDSMRMVEADPAMLPEYSQEQLIGEMTQTCCLNETWNSTLLGYIYQRSEWPSIKAAARRLLGDEIWHSRLGWAYLNTISAASSLSWLSRDIVPMLKTSGAIQILADETSDELEAYGEVSGETRRRLFCDTFGDVISPGLEMVGVCTAEAKAWLKSMQFG
ncbi:MAG: hypothetical protein VYA30_02880 [Myxococcota bacterium]|nr:hypothetical protein [Myxococcota bacterium]